MPGRRQLLPIRCCPVTAAERVVSNRVGTRISDDDSPHRIGRGRRTGLIAARLMNGTWHSANFSESTSSRYRRCA